MNENRILMILISIILISGCSSQKLLQKKIEKSCNICDEFRPGEIKDSIIYITEKKETIDTVYKTIREEITFVSETDCPDIQETTYMNGTNSIKLSVKDKVLRIDCIMLSDSIQVLNKILSEKQTNKDYKEKTVYKTKEVFVKNKTNIWSISTNILLIIIISGLIYIHFKLKR